MNNRLEIFIKQTFGEEGSFQKNSKDKGNYNNGKLYGTIWGITARDHYSTFLSCYRLWQAGEIARSKNYAVEFYKNAGYWNPLYDEIDDSSLAFRIWDFGINAGVVRSIKYLQQVINKNYANVKIDGVFGKHTLRAVNTYGYPMVRKYPKIKLIEGETEFYTLYVERLEKHYRSLWNFFEFGKGWINRLKRVFNGVPDLYKPIEIRPVEKVY